MENKFKEFCEKSGLKADGDRHERNAYLSAKNAWDIQQKEIERLQGVVDGMNTGSIPLSGCAK